MAPYGGPERIAKKPAYAGHFLKNLFLVGCVILASRLQRYSPQTTTCDAFLENLLPEKFSLWHHPVLWRCFCCVWIIHFH
jgi:hypothetical protein